MIYSHGGVSKSTFLVHSKTPDMDEEKCTRIWKILENSVHQVINTDGKYGKMINQFTKTGKTDMKDQQKSSAKFLGPNDMKT